MLGYAALLGKVALAPVITPSDLKNSVSIENFESRSSELVLLINKLIIFIIGEKIVIENR